MDRGDLEVGTRASGLSEPPAKVGPYELVELLGRGGMGEVYRAFDQRLGRDVAIKHLRPELANDSTARARVRREARALARLSHPSIVPVFDLVDNDTGVWIVMELVEGPNLATVLGSRPLAPVRALDVGLQLARGLVEAHERGILHRDLKAENVLMTRSGQARIVDFGLAKPLFRGDGEGSLSMAGAVLGTCRSMSPEQARGLEVDPRSDLFSFGVLLYEMLSGRSPFEAATPADTLTRVCTHRQEPVSTLAPAVPWTLSEIVDRLLAKAPERRPQSAAVITVELEALATVGIGGGEASPAGASVGPSSPRDSAVPRGEETLLPESEGIARPVSASLSRSAWRLGGLVALLVVVATPALLRDSGRWSWQGAEVTQGDAFTLFQNGMDLLERYDKAGHLDRAIDTFRRAVELDRESAPAHAGLARAYCLKYRNGRRDRQWLSLALPAARRAVEFGPYLAVAGVSLGMVEHSLGRHAEAEAELRRVLDLHPESAAAFRALGRLELDRNRFADAETAFLRALEITPADPWLWSHLGELYFRTQRLEEAEAAFRRELELRPDSAFAHRNLGGVFQMQGQLGEAAAAIQRSLEIQPETSSYANLGVLLFTQGMYGESAVAFERVLETGTMTHDSQAWANLADAYRWVLGREAKAREAYLRAIQLARRDLAADPGDVTQRSRLAQYLAKHGSREEALLEVERVAGLADGDAAALYRQAVTLEIVGERPRALEALEAALSAGYPLKVAEADPELIALRAAPAFHRLAAGFEGPAG